MITPQLCAALPAFLRYRTRDTVVQNWLPLEVLLENFYPALTTEFLASSVVGQEACP
jgi:hypothetical protein